MVRGRSQGGFGIIIVGDELLSGRRRDRHFDHVVDVLAGRGLTLDWAHVVGDDPARLTGTLRATLAGADTVFCFGGIGATPDDRTRECAARAAGVELVRHPGAVAEIEARFAAQAYPNRIRMAELPAGCALIPNPYNRIPGFTLSGHHFLPGFPVMAWPMLEWVLDNCHGDRRGTPPDVYTVTVLDAHESELVSLMEALVADYPEIRLSSLPHLGDSRPRIEVGLRGYGSSLAGASESLRAGLLRLGLRWREGGVGSSD
ncbi:MAG: molybdopterin-binding protein [Gammaproteobacteria bacterium]